MAVLSASHLHSFHPHVDFEASEILATEELSLQQTAAAHKTWQLILHAIQHGNIARDEFPSVRSSMLGCLHNINRHPIRVRAASTIATGINDCSLVLMTWCSCTTLYYTLGAAD